MSHQIKDIVHSEQLHLKQIEYEEVPIDSLKLDILTAEEQEKFKTFRSDRRRREFYFTRLLYLSFHLNQTIDYKPTGKPYIKDGFISFSHSQNIIIAGYSKQHELGIDIEFYKQKIERVAHKFIHPKEERLIATDRIKNLTNIWSLKEAIYKLEDIPGLRFKEDMQVLNFSPGGKIVVHKNNTEHVYRFSTLFFSDFLITYSYLIKN